MAPGAGDPGTSPWAPAGPVPSLLRGGGLVTIVEGASFAVSGRSGDIAADHPHGLFVLDTRLLSRWELTLAGQSVEPLAVAVDAPYEATFVARTHPHADEADSELLVFRRRSVGDGMRECVTVHNFGLHPVATSLALLVDADFADVFEVKGSRVTDLPAPLVTRDPTRWRFDRVGPGVAKQVDVHVTPATTPPPAGGDDGVPRLRWDLVVPASGSVEVCVEVSLTLDGHPLEPRFRCGQPDDTAVPAARQRAWRAGAPVVESDRGALVRAVDQAIDDLGALRIHDPRHPEAPVVAAGAPWFMTLFGRDSLLTSWMALLVDPSLALGVLETLARYQGSRTDDRTEEQPGRIVHEVRFDESSSLSLGGGSAYYGTADATPLFVMLVGELARWGVADDAVDRLLPHVDRAMAWIAGDGDPDRDGYVEYRRRNPEGLANQGWKDSWDGISFADGRLPEAPIALCEVQAYVHAAHVARAELAERSGDRATADRHRGLAAELRVRFHRDFWLEEQGWFAVGLDADERPIDALTSNVGHCLWAGIAGEEQAARVAEHLVSPAMFSGWGVRTLATTMARYNPVSYHNGSVWPHDTAICAAGLHRYGLRDEAHRLEEGLLDLAEQQGGRLPELFAGFDRSELSVPAPYPTSCSPQAWSAAAPLLLLRAMLGLEPSGTHGQVTVDPDPPPSVRHLVVHGVPVGGRRVDVRWPDGGRAGDGVAD